MILLIDKSIKNRLIIQLNVGKRILHKGTVKGIRHAVKGNLPLRIYLILATLALYIIIPQEFLLYRYRCIRINAREIDRSVTGQSGNILAGLIPDIARISFPSLHFRPVFNDISIVRIRV